MADVVLVLAGLHITMRFAALNIDRYHIAKRVVVNGQAAPFMRAGVISLPPHRPPSFPA